MLLSTNLPLHGLRWQFLPRAQTYVYMHPFSFLPPFEKNTSIVTNNLRGYFSPFPRSHFVLVFGSRSFSETSTPSSVSPSQMQVYVFLMHQQIKIFDSKRLLVSTFSDGYR